MSVPTLADMLYDALRGIREKLGRSLPDLHGNKGAMDAYFTAVGACRYYELEQEREEKDERRLPRAP